MNSGFLLVNKKPGPTSHDVVDSLRRITGIKKIGHAGTLDPFASGLLLVAVSREATREISKFVGLGKTYESEIVIGMSSTTLDTEGELESMPVPKQSIERLGEAMQSLTGELEQIPPMHSAIKIGGQKLYNLARQGKEVERKPRKVEIKKFELIGEPENQSDDTIKINTLIECSSGTYIRALARDLGEKLDTAAYLTNLKRTRIGEFDIKDAHTLEELSPENWPDFLISVE